MAPAAVLVTVGDSRAERCRGSTTPVTPAHSALRRSAPRLRGSVSPAATSRKGALPRRSGAARSSSATGSSGRARARTPWGDSVRACESSRARGTVSTGTRMRPASSSMRSSCGEGSWSSASMIRRTVRRPTVSSSSTARRPSTWSPPSSLRGPGRRSPRWPPPSWPPRPPPPLPGRPPPARPLPPAPRPGSGRLPVRRDPPFGGGRGLTTTPSARRPGRRCPRPVPVRRAPRPGSPSPTRGRRSTAPRRSTMAAVCGARRGASATMVQSALAQAKPCPAAMATTSVSRATLSAPSHTGSVSGKCRPRSPSPTAPSTASASAWHTASASLWPPSPRAPSITTPPSTSGRWGSSEKRWTSMPWPMRMLTVAVPPAAAPPRRGRRGR